MLFDFSLVEKTSKLRRTTEAVLRVLINGSRLFLSKLKVVFQGSFF